LRFQLAFSSIVLLSISLAQTEMPTRSTSPVVNLNPTATTLKGTRIPSNLPLPKVQPEIPGSVQPRAPGQKNPQALNRIPNNLSIPEILKIEYASNGFIEVAHALIVIPQKYATTERELSFAFTAVQRAFSLRPALEEVDFSVFEKEGFAGAGGPLPRLTGSIPKPMLKQFLNLTANSLSGFERIWLNGGKSQKPLRQATTEKEIVPTYSGDSRGLEAQQAQQEKLEGGVTGGLLFQGSSESPIISLTFDDAPHPLYEPLLLDILRRTHVKATFFCIGRNAEAYPYFVRDMVRQGHEIGNHTYHHVRLVGLSDQAVADELESTNKILKSITGINVKYFRPPGGRYSSQTLQSAFKAGLTTTFWTDDPGDFRNSGEKILERRLVKRLRYGGIVLLHDNVLESIQVLPQFLKAAFERGIHVDNISGMLDGI
jgi:peptidoglycan-N-acetylglucosamine deacetylase